MHRISLIRGKGVVRPLQVCKSEQVQAQATQGRDTCQKQGCKIQDAKNGTIPKIGLEGILYVLT